MHTTLVFPRPYDILSLQTAEQKEFLTLLTDSGSAPAMTWLDTIQNKRELTFPETILFRWITDCQESILELSEDADFSAPLRYCTNGNELSIENLKAGTTYFWRVNHSEVSSFCTEERYPRFIHIEGLVNIRDIGGIDSISGSRIRQGMVYRGSELNSSFDARYHNLAVDSCFYDIAQSGKTVFCNELKIRTELDFRGDQLGKITQSPAGPYVVLQQIPLRPYAEIFSEEHKKNTAAILNFMAEPSHYPVYIHCRGGMDRTGMITMFLQAICGFAEEALHREYEYSSLCSIGQRKRSTEYYTEFLQKMAEYASSQSLPEQIKVFLLECGVTEACMEKICAILKES